MCRFLKLIFGTVFSIKIILPGQLYSQVKEQQQTRDNQRQVQQHSHLGECSVALNEREKAARPLKNPYP
jgi:hypothetical protein